MASSTSISGLFGWYTHTLTVWVISQDITTNTSRLGYRYDVRREPSPSKGAWTTLNSVTFNATIGSNTRSDNPNFDFRGGGYRTITMLSGEVTATHGPNGALDVPLSFSCNALADPAVSRFPAASGSGTFPVATIPRASTVSMVPNPVVVGEPVTITLHRADPSFVHDLTWVRGSDSGTIATGVGATYTWTPSSSILGANQSTVISVQVQTRSGATPIGDPVLKDLTIRQPPVYPEVGTGTPYDIRFRRMELDTGTWLPREVIPALTMSFTDAASSTATCNFSVSQLSYKTSLEEAVVRLDAFDGSRWIDTGLAFILSRVEEESTDLSGEVKYTGTSYVDYLLARGIVTPEREWNDFTPGAIMGHLYNEGTARGWGSFLGRTFNTDSTSAGTPWVNKTNRKLTDGLHLSQVLDGLVTDVLVEYRTSFRDNKFYLDLYNPGYGSDWTVPGADPIINLSTGAMFKVVDKAPVRKDFGSRLTRVSVQGDEATRTRERSASINPELGHLEGSVSASGVSDPAQLDKLGDAALEQAASATVERTFSYDLSSPATPEYLYPYRTFRPGDWVLVPASNGLERARISQVAITRNADTTQATITVGDMIPSGLAATARKLTQASGGAIAGGTLQSQATLKSTIPSAPQNVVGVPDGYWDITGAPRAGVLLTWEPVTLSLESSSVTVDLYEIWTREEIGSPWVLSFLSDTNSVTMAPLSINDTFDVQVRARSVAGVYGEFSDLITVDTPEPDELLPAPSDPLVESNALGTVAVSWDGLVGGDSPPLWFSYLRAEISDSEFGAYSVAGTQLPQSGTITVPEVGSGTWWFRLVPVDRLGRDGTPSDAVSHVVSVVVGDTRKPKAPAGLVVTSEGYWSASTPESSIIATWTPVTEAEDNTPINIKVYEVWGRLATDSVPHLLASTAGTAVGIAPMGPIGSDWVITVRAVAENNEQGSFSAAETVELEQPGLVLDPATVPIVNSARGVIIISWDGMLSGDEGNYPAPALLAHVDVEVSIDAGGTWTRMGFLTQGSRTATINGVAVGESAQVRLVAVDRLGQSAPASTIATVVVVGISGSDLVANSVTANEIAAGSITVDLVSPSFGSDLNIASNNTVTILAGQVSDVQDATDQNADNLAEMRTRYDFTPTEAVISQPGSPFQVAISNTQMEFRESGVARAFLNAGVFNAPRMASSSLVLEWHVIEDDPNGTVIRRR